MANIGVTFDFAAESAKLRSEIDRVRREVAGLKDTNDGIISSFKSVGAALIGAFSVGAITSQLVQAGKAAIAFGDEMQKAAARTGIGAGEFAALADAARLADIDTTSLSKALQKMQVAVSEAGSGSKSQLETFAALGIQFDDLRKLAPEDQFLRIADGINNLQDPADRVRASVELFGKAGAELLPFFEQGAEGIRKATDEIERLGGKLTDDQIKKLADADDAIKRLDQSWTNFARTLTAAVAPALTSVLNALTGQTIGQVEADLGLALAKLNDLKKLQAEYSKPGMDQRVLADINRQIDETNRKVGELRLNLYSLQGPASGPQRRTNGPEQAPVAPGFAAAAAAGAGGAGGAAGSRASGAAANPFAGIDAQSNRTLNSNLREFDPSTDIESMTAAARYAYLEQLQQDHEAKSLGFLAGFHDSWLGQMLTANDTQIAADQYKYATIGEMMSVFAQTAMQHGGALGKVGKALAIAQTIWATASAVMQTYQNAGGYPWGIAPAAAMAAIGLSQLASITKTNVGSGGSIPSARGGGASAATPSLPTNVPASRSTESEHKTAAQIIVNGNLFAAQETVDWLVGKIADAVNNRDMVFINGNSRQAMELVGP